ncbi:hypothetical protein UFOVP1313_68 [uncultured Caudovirales phage]|uniref:Uncharacterized protein n=1 Tax=uncultured Caudovirales phage TaxID=2100421 RepID=A0A6J5RLN7_9CAUD|nr:hypothetical protein UFOVP1313_68 [uncultured Caudovirales phage]
MNDSERREWTDHEKIMVAKWEEHERKFAEQEHREVEKYNDGVEEPTKPCAMDYCDGFGLLNVHEADDQLCNFCMMVDRGMDDRELDQ